MIRASFNISSSSSIDVHIKEKKVEANAIYRQRVNQPMGGSDDAVGHLCRFI